MPPIPSLTYRMLHEPLLHFLILAVVLFLIDSTFSSLQKEKIHIDAQTAQYLVKQREDLEMRKLTTEEKQKIVMSYVTDEILYNEAYKRGLDRGDSRMRRNMILKVRGLMTDEIEEPTEAQLRDYFKHKRSEYSYPANWSMLHIFFSDPTQVPDDLLAKLNAVPKSGLSASPMSEFNPETLGDYRPGLGRQLQRRSRRDLAGAFGAESAQTIIAIDDKQWHGPIESVQGVHFVSIIASEPTRDADFDHIRDYLQRDWLIKQGQVVIQKKIDGLRENYDIVIEEYTESKQAEAKQ